MSLWNDIRLAARGFSRTPGFTLVAVMALAIGIGVNTTFFTIVNAICLRGPIEHSDGLVHVGTRQSTGAESGFSAGDFRDLRESSRTFEALAAYAAAPVALADDTEAAERVIAAYITAGAFTTLGESPALGRDFTATDDSAGAEPVVILAHTVWANRYGADSRVVGRTVRINGTPATVLGVMRDGFRFPNDAGIWLPLFTMPAVAAQPRDSRTLGVFARLRHDVTVDGARADADVVLARLAETYPDTNRGIRARVVPINAPFTPSVTDPAWIAFILAGTLVLLIACANVANLLLARASGRTGEIAIRTSLGASRRRVIRQLLVESAVLAAAGGLVGLALTLVGARLLWASIPDGMMPSWMAFTVDYQVLGALAATCLGTVFVFGLVPALSTGRTDVRTVLQQQHAGGPLRGVRRWTTMFLVSEFALTFVLLAMLALDWRSFQSLQRAEQVVDTRDLMTASLVLPAPRYPEATDRARFLDALVARVQPPGREVSASIASVLPYSPTAQRRLIVEGRTPPPPGQPLPEIATVAIGDSYFRTLGTPLLAGREFSPVDGTAGAQSAIVSDRFARTYFPGQDALGRRVRLIADTSASDRDEWLTIVGVVPTIRQGGGELAPVAYVPIRSAVPPSLAVLVRGPAASQPASMLRNAVRELDADLPLFRVQPMDQVIADAGWNARMSSTLLHLISGVALLLALVGLYAVTSYTVMQRRREFGVRVAVGARPLDVLSLVLRRVALQLASGIALGIVGIVAWQRFLPATSGGLRASDPGSLAAVAVVVIVVGTAASLLPARRAASAQPVSVLRASG